MNTFTPHRQDDAPSHDRVLKVPNEATPEQAASDAVSTAKHLGETTLLCYRGGQVAVIPGQNMSAIMPQLEALDPPFPE